MCISFCKFWEKGFTYKLQNFVHQNFVQHTVLKSFKNFHGSISCCLLSHQAHQDLLKRMSRYNKSTILFHILAMCSLVQSKACFTSGIHPPGSVDCGCRADSISRLVLSLSLSVLFSVRCPILSDEEVDDLTFVSI